MSPSEGDGMEIEIGLASGEGSIPLDFVLRA